MLRLALTFLFFATPARAAEMVFYFNNKAPFGVAVELSGPDSRKLWPGEGKVYLLDKGERKSVRIECRANENICYGAWRNGDDTISWGIGPDHDALCNDCCFACVEKSAETIDIGP